MHGGHTKAFVNEAIDIFCLMWSDTEKFQIRLYNIYDLLPKKIIDHWQENFTEAFEIFITLLDGILDVAIEAGVILLLN